MSLMEFTQEDLGSPGFCKVHAKSAIHLEVLAGRMTQNEGDLAISKFGSTVSLRQYYYALVFAKKRRKQ